MTPEDIFRMFFGQNDFGGSFNGGHQHPFFRTYTFNGNNRPNNRQRQNAQNLGFIGVILQMLPMILIFGSMFLPTFISSFSSNSSYNDSGYNNLENNYFSLTKNGEFMNKRETSVGTIYYIKNENRRRNQHNILFGNPYQFYKPNKNTLEKSVESSYLNKLIKSCNNINNNSDKYLNDIKNNKKLTNKQRINKIKKYIKIKNNNNNNNHCNKLNEYIQSLS